MSSPSAMSRCTAMMSARGTMTSATRRSRSPRMFLSIVRSVGEKPVSPAPSSSTSLRLERTVLDRSPRIARSVRLSQPSALSGATGAGRGTGTGRLRDALGSLGLAGSESGMDARTIGIGDIKPGEDGGFEPFHRVRLVILGVIVAGKMQKSMHRQVRQMMRERLALGARLAFRRLVSDHDVAEQAGRAARAARGTGRKRQHIGRAGLAAPIPGAAPDPRLRR